MDGPVGNQKLPKEVMIPYWESVMTNARDSCPPPAQQDPIIWSLWSPVSSDEVRSALPERNTAPGPLTD
ncbi:hypothetical protein K0M31_020447 [Melipona bicolor]|uniref:Uncharacterized protein n=1 Tax=Melipona bicolor TaxID=60889 RepID=A0AA40FCF5_9HYME|nr:hypothetical protein K0M31_020447 [Melipona bicolor]